MDAWGNITDQLLGDRSTVAVSAKVQTDRYLQRTGQPTSANFPRVTLYPFAGYEVDGTIPPTSPTQFTTVRQHLGGYGLRHSVYSGAVPVTVWLHSDRLGSVVAKTDQNGAVAMNALSNGHPDRHGYDAFGRPRRGSWDADVSSGPSAGQPGNQGVMRSQYSRRGFTGHEHLDDSYGQHKLIHMNGRMYDPQLGRFLGVDPIIQFPANGQSLNPYSYIMNNPMSGTDPTGYAACSPDGPKEGEICDIKATERKREAGSRILKEVTTTYTVANNGGVLYVTPGRGPEANSRIKAFMIGSGSERPSGPSMGPVPMSIGERGPNMVMCAKVGVGCEAEYYLYDPLESVGQPASSEISLAHLRVLIRTDTELTR
jgi:RHS repeat-associated protein